MDFVGLYSSLAVSDMRRAEDWFTKVIGRPPDHHPMPTLTQWVGLAGAGVQLFLIPGKAGNSVATWVIRDIEAARSLLAEQGITLGEISRGDFGAVAHISDPDGNVITLAEPPGRSASAA